MATDPRPPRGEMEQPNSGENRRVDWEQVPALLPSFTGLWAAHVTWVQRCFAHLRTAAPSGRPIWTLFPFVSLP